jgi:DHA1 family bicyclomycin/chloramphenicol resistance-like MFS transporter
MLIGRFLQGLGAAGPRIVAIALVRDQYEGNTMAKVISLVMAVFVIVPALAPAVGQGLLLIAHWRVIFVVLFALAVISLVWFALRQPETLALGDRVPLSVARIMTAIVEVCTHRTALGYTIAAGLIFGAFVGFLSSVQQILQEQYALGAKFPLYFAALALSIGSASLVNSRLVMHYGMQKLSLWAVLTASVLSSGFLLFSLIVQSSPSLIVLMTYLVALFFCIGILFGNFNALAMEPMGHIAGVASAVIGSIITALSVLLGASIGAMYDGTVVPMVAGFTVLGTFALLAVYITQRSEPSGQSGNS